MKDSRKQLKKFITEKFGTQSQFCRLAGVNRYELQILWAVKNPSKEFIARIEALSRRVKPKAPYEALTPPKLKSLRGAINASGGVGAFCKANKQFSRHTVNKVLAGAYKKLDGKPKELLAHFALLRIKP